MAFEVGEAAVPHTPVGREPALDLAQHSETKAIDATRPFGGGLDQAGVAKHPKVARRVRLAQPGLADELFDRARPFAQQVEGLPASRFGDDETVANV